MIISKPPPERLIPASDAITALIESLLQGSVDQIIEIVSGILSTTQSLTSLLKSDLYHWIPVLNKFDGLLESILAEYPTEPVQLKDYSSLDKKVLLSILKFERLLWENCTNRNLYNSYDRLNALLSTCDLDVLESVLKLLLRPAQRIPNQRSLRTGLQATQDKLKTLAFTLPLKTYSSDFKHMISRDFKFSAKSKRFKFQFYRFDIDATVKNDDQVLIDEPFKSLSYETVTLNVKVPDNDRFALFHQIRFALSLSDHQKRTRLLLIHLYAMASYIYLIEEDDLYSQFLIIESDYITQLTGILQEHTEKSQNAFDSAIVYVLDSLCKFKAKQSEILSALSASVHHGAILKLIRAIISDMSSQPSEAEYSQEFIDAVFGFVTSILTSQSGGTMLISAGIIEAFVNALSISNVSSYKNIVKCVTALDNIVYSFTSAFNTFTHANGIDILVCKIKDEIKECETIRKMGADTQGTKIDAPTERLVLLRALLKLILHLMQASGTSERMRHLIDSTLPKSLEFIFEASEAYSANVYGIAITIMATFIHNEPTCLSILQEMGLDKKFMLSVCKDFPVSPEVITAIPNAFGAVCLNAPGIEFFLETKPMGKFLGNLCTEGHIKSVYENDVAVLIGNSVDELVRHHPSTKEDVFKAILDMIKKISAHGNQVREQDRAHCEILNKEYKDGGVSMMSQFIDVIGRFLEGLFQNTSHCKEFIKLDGVPVLVQLLALPTIAYDFASSSYSYSLSHVFRLLLETNAEVCGEHIIPIFSEYLQKVIKYVKDGHKLLSLVSASQETNEATIREYNEIYRCLIGTTIFIRIFTDAFTSPNTKTITCTLAIFGGEYGIKLLNLIGEIHRQAHLENILLKHTLSPKLFEKEAVRDKVRVDPLVAVRKELEIDDKDDVNSFESKNAKHIRFLLAQICLVIPPLMQNVVKVVSHRRVMEAGNKKTANSMIECIGCIFSDHLAHTDIEAHEPVDFYMYAVMITGCLSSVITDDRGFSGLQTNVLVAFTKANGLGRFVHLVQVLLGKTSESCSENVLEKIYQALDIMLNLLPSICNHKAILESSNTVALVSKERNKSAEAYFNPHHFLVQIRLLVLQSLKGYWHEDAIIKLPSYLIKHFVLIMKHIYQAEGEIDVEVLATQTASSSLASAISSLTASMLQRSRVPVVAAPVVPVPRVIDETHVGQLVEMGFSDQAARVALRRYRRLEEATEWLLMNPHPDIPVADASVAVVQGEEIVLNSQNNVENENTDVVNDVTMEVVDDEHHDESEEDDENEDDQDDPMEEDDDYESDTLSAALGIPMSEILQMDAERMAISANPRNNVTVNLEAQRRTDHEKNLETLNALRIELREISRAIALRILDTADDVAFEIKDFLAVLEKDNLDSFIGSLVANIQNLQKATAAQEEKKAFSNRIRLFAMFTNDQSSQLKAIKSAGLFIPALIDMVRDEVDTADQRSLSPILLVIESFISLSTEPRTIKSDLPDTTMSEDIDLPEPLLNSQLESLLAHLIKLLDKDLLNKDLLNAIYRLLVRVTRVPALTDIFIKRDGLALLFRSNHLARFSGQQSLLVMILRHILENHSILTDLLKKEIKHWLTFPRQRTIEMGIFLKQGASLICRSPEDFVNATKKVCKLSSYVPSSKLYQIAFNDALAGEELTEIDTSENSVHSDVLAQFMVQEFMAIKSISIDKDQSDTDLTDNHIKRCYILQLLEELVLSYPTFKLDLLTGLTRKGKASATPMKIKNNFLHYLLNDLIPYSHPMKLTSKSVPELLVSEAAYASSFVIALCSFEKQETESETFKEFKESCIRIVLDAIAKVVKDILALPCCMDQTFSKMITICQLIYEIPTVKDVNPFSGGVSATQSMIVKLMLEKNFVTFLTQMASEIDINYPEAKTVIKHIMKPLEYLTTFANKLEDTNKFKVQDVTDVENVSSYDEDDEMMQQDVEQADAISELTRNSALNMFASRHDDDDESMDDMSEEDDEDEFNDYDDEDLDNPEDEIESDVQDDMEIILPAPYRNEQDEDDTSDGSISDSDENLEIEVIEEEGHDHGAANDMWEDVDDDSENDEDGALDAGNEERDEDEDGGDEDEEGDIHNRFDSELDEEGEEFLNMFEGAPEMMFEDEFVDGFRGGRRVNRGQISRGARSRILGGGNTDGPAIQIQWEVNAPDGSIINANNLFGATSRRPARNQDIVSHPLLTAAVETTQARPDNSQQRRDLGAIIRASSGERLDFQAFEELIGGNAIQFLEQLMTRASTGNRPTGIAIRDGAATESRGIQITSASDSAADNLSSLPVELKDDRLSSIHNFNVMKTSDRWNQEAKFMYGNHLQDKGLRLHNAILNVLIPPAEEEYNRVKAEFEEKKKKEAEEKARMEEEVRIQKAEEDRKKSEELASQAPVEQEAATEDVTEVRIYVNLAGREVDITGSGMDPEFINALPEDLRQEVITQYVRDQRRALQPSAPENLNEDFLNALPFEIREEVIEFERMETERRQRPERGGNEQIRPPTSAGRLIRSSDLRAVVPTPTSTSKKIIESVQLIDKSGLVSLMRLLFVPDPTNVEMVNRVITNFSYNNKNRADVVAFILSILLDETDLSAHEKHGVKSRQRYSLSSVNATPTATSTASVTFKTPTSVSQGVNAPQTPSVSQITSGVIPNLIPERCLELLFHMVSYNHQICKYFLLESELFHHAFNRNLRPAIKRGKWKSIQKYPVAALLLLLEKPLFLNNSNLMELLMQIISIVMRSLPILIKRSQNSEAKKDLDQTGKVEEISGISDVSLMEIQTQSETVRQSEDGNIKSAEQIMMGAKSNNIMSPKPAVYRPPQLPEYQLQSIVSVLKRGECSNKAFQYTLSTIQQLSFVSDYKQILSNQLGEAAIEISTSMLSDLEALGRYFEELSEKAEVDTNILLKFSSPSSEETKLLRVLKSIDFLYLSASSPESKASAHTSITVLADENSMLLRQLYDTFNLKNVWSQLSNLLRIINNHEKATHVANVMLPLIEAFMVVSKPYITMYKGKMSISRSPSDIQIVPNEEMFLTFTEEHKKLMNNMVRNCPSLMSGSFALLVHNPKVLEFDNKRTYFNQQLHKKSKRDRFGVLNLNVRRPYVFEDSYHQLQGRSGEEIKYSKLSVKFNDEEGVDAGGVTREWFSVLARQMFNPDYALFRPSAADKVTYQPNRSSWINPDHILYFRFVGRVIGKAIYDNRLLDAYFTRSFYKCMIGTKVDWRDMEAVDPEFHKSLEWMMNNDITDIIDLTFSCEVDDFGNKKIVDLIPNGQNIAVTEANKHEYVNLITEQRLITAIKPQIEGFLGGFHDVIPKDLIKIFNEQELELLISGLPDIDIDDWKNNTDYHNYTLSSPPIQWFWRAVRSFTQEERAKLIQFVTGTSKVPLEGFASLQGSGGIQKFQIHKDFSTDRLPAAHTCFNQLDLPQYENYETLRSNLLTSINECGTGFGFA